MKFQPIGVSAYKIRPARANFPLPSRFGSLIFINRNRSDNGRLGERRQNKLFMGCEQTQIEYADRDTDIAHPFGRFLSQWRTDYFRRTRSFGADLYAASRVMVMAFGATRCFH